MVCKNGATCKKSIGSCKKWKNSNYAKKMGKSLLQLARKHKGLDNFTSNLVGTQNTCLLCRRRNSFCGKKFGRGKSAGTWKIWKRCKLDRRNRCAWYLVFISIMAIFNIGMAKRNWRSEKILSNKCTCYRGRHIVLLGSKNGNDESLHKRWNTI